MQYNCDLAVISGVVAPDDVVTLDGGPGTSWEVSDSARALITLPAEYVAGTAVVLRMEVWTSTVNKVNNFTVELTVSGQVETITASFTSAAVANTSVSRDFTLATAGYVGSHALVATDVLQFDITRIAGTDTATLITLGLPICFVESDPAVAGNYSGRLGKIVNEVRALTKNYATTGMAREEILAHVNTGVSYLNAQQIKRAKYSVTMAIGTSTVTLSSLSAYIGGVYGVVIIGTADYQARRLQELPYYAEELFPEPQSGVFAWHVDGDTLTLTGAVEEACTIVIEVWEWLPLLSEYATVPGTPVPFDSFYSFFAAASVVYADPRSKGGIGPGRLFQEQAEKLMKQMLVQKKSLPFVLTAPRC